MAMTIDQLLAALDGAGVTQQGLTVFLTQGGLLVQRGRLEEAIAKKRREQAESNQAFETAIQELENQLALDRQALANAKVASSNAELALSQRKVMDGLDAPTAATNRYAEAIGKLDLRHPVSIKDGKKIQNIYMGEVMMPEDSPKKRPIWKSIISNIRKNM